MKRPTKPRTCSRCGCESKRGNKVGPSGICRLCTELIPRKLRDHYWSQRVTRAAA